jgi:hypothetical protein
MTLTDALRAALAIPPTIQPSDSHPLWQIFATDPSNPARTLVALVLHFGLNPRSVGLTGSRVADQISPILETLISAGASAKDVDLLRGEPMRCPEIPRSAEWVSAAERLAAWADGVAP